MNNPYTAPEADVTGSTSTPQRMRDAWLYPRTFLGLVLLTFALSYPLYKFILPVPGAVALAIGGMLAGALIGFLMGRRHRGRGVRAVGFASVALALPIAVFFIALSNPDEKFAILSGLGYFAIPFSAMTSSLIGLALQEHASSGGGV